MQHTIASSNRRGTSHAMWYDGAPNSGRHRTIDISRRRVAGVAVLVLIGLALAGLAGWHAFVQTGSASRQYPVSERSSRQSHAAADVWIRTNLPAGTRLLVDGFDLPPGYQSVPLTTVGDDWRNFRYLVTSTITNPPVDTALATVWKSSTPVAIFGDGEVRYVLPQTPPDDIGRNHETDRVERLQAGAALRENPQLTASPTARDALAAGQLDLRAAAMLTAIVTQVPFALDQIVVDAPEAAAMMPARSITIYTSDPGGFTRALSGVAPAMAPDQVTVGENGAIALHWPLSVTPMPSVN